MQDTEYCISAGEFAKLCKTTRDTLRYYDKMGILVPKKNDENGYNYYSPRQITSFYFISFYRALECPVKQLKEFMNEPGSDDFYKLINNQYDTLLDMKREIENKLELLTIAIDMVNHIKNNPDGKVILEKLPYPIINFYTPVKSSPAKSFDQIMSDIARHLNRCAETDKVKSFPMGATIKKEDFINNEYTYSRVFSVADNTITNSETIKLPTSTLVSCVIHDSSEDVEHVYKRILKYVDANNLTLKSDVHSLSLLNIVDANDTKRFLKYIYVCV